MRNSAPLDEAFVPIQRRILGKYTKKQLIDQLFQYDTPFDANKSKEELIEILIQAMKNEQPEIETKSKKFDIKVYLPSIARYSILLIFLYLIFFSVCLSIFYLIVPKPQKLCNTHQQSMYCITCPRFAKCFNNTATCDNGYTYIGYHCLEIDNTTEIISKMLEYTILELRKHAGKYKCRQCQNHYLTVDQLDALVFSQNFVDPKSYDQMFQKIINILQLQYNISTQYIDLTQVFTSTIPDRPFSCVFRHFIYSTIFLYVFLCLIILGIRYTYKKIKIQQSINNKAQIMAIKVIDILRTYDTEIEVTHLKSRLSKESEIDISLWPLIFSHIKKSPYVMVTKYKGNTFIRVRGY